MRGSQLPRGEGGRGRRGGKTVRMERSSGDVPLGDFSRSPLPGRALRGSSQPHSGAGVLQQRVSLTFL